MAADQTCNAFISYSHMDRECGARVKSVLGEVGIQAFLAHDDLQVSDEWRNRILQELRCCDLFVPLLSEHFVASEWAPQEVGIIVSRPEVVIAPLSIDGTRSFGFVGHLQSPRIPKEGVTRALLVEPLAGRMPRRILPGLIRIAAKAGSFRSAEDLMRPLVPHFSTFTPDEAQAFADAAVANGQIWSAALCHEEYLPAFIRIQGSNIRSDTLRALEYQLEHQQWYNGGRT